jgi:hypothetical protein
MIRSNNYHLMLSRGRKAGLTAGELNASLSMQPVASGEREPGQPDCNGFVSGVDAQGHRTSTPIAQPPRTSKVIAQDS